MNQKWNRLQGVGKWNLVAIFSVIAVILLGVMQIQPVAAQPLEEMLSEGGTLDLDSGYRGSIDISGFELVSGEGETPRFEALASVPGDEKWQPGLNPPGMSDDVFALAFNGAGNLYTGVPLDHPDADWINQEKTEGITTGCGDGSNFCPNELLSQRGFQKMLVEAF